MEEYKQLIPADLKTTAERMVTIQGNQNIKKEENITLRGQEIITKGPFQVDWLQKMDHQLIFNYFFFSTSQFFRQELWNMDFFECSVTEDTFIVLLDFKTG